MTCDVDWVLLVEKDTVWSKIAQSAFPQLNRCLLITVRPVHTHVGERCCAGPELMEPHRPSRVWIFVALLVQDRGMPSKATRRFLKKFHDYFPTIPIFGLFDPDPSGLDIYRVCKHGAERSVHEDLALPCLQLLGVCIRDIEQLGILHLSSVGQPLTPADRKKLEKMMQSEVGCNDPIIRRECESLLQLNRKAEIESLTKVDEYYLTDHYLLQKLKQLATATAVDDVRMADDMSHQLTPSQLHQPELHQPADVPHHHASFASVLRHPSGETKEEEDAYPVDLHGSLASIDVCDGLTCLSPSSLPSSSLRAPLSSPVLTSRADIDDTDGGVAPMSIDQDEDDEDDGGDGWF
jgi:hypothetical protein